jgi:glutathione synthase/RimK-type ligase-like ATP-grasp enzyme
MSYNKFNGETLRVLVLTEKEKQARLFVTALKAKGVKTNSLQLIKISLISKHKNTLIKAIDEDIPKYDAVFLQARTNLAPFIEPLIDSLQDKGIYCNALPGSYYLAVNEPYKFVNLCVNNVPTPRNLISGSGKNIEKVSKNVSYPLVAKSFLGKDVQQSTIINSDKELENFVKSIKTKIDGFVLREFVDACVISCVVIGEKVFAIDRKSGDTCVNDLSKGRSYRPTEKEKEIVIRAAKASSLSIARVDLVNGLVIAVDPEIPTEVFNKVCSVDLEMHIASFFVDKVNEIGPKRRPSDELRDLASKLHKTILGSFLK